MDHAANDVAKSVSYSSPPRPARVEPGFDRMNEFSRFLRDREVRSQNEAEPKTLKAWIDLAETYRITQALQECRGNRSAAARVLGIGRRTLYAKMDKLGITATWRVG